MFYWPIENPRVRSDDAGSGAFGASRVKLVGDERVRYPHRGVDLLGDPGDPIFAPCTGTVERNGICYNPEIYPGRAHLKLTVVSFPLGRFKLLYVDPDVQAGQVVTAGDRIATLQDVAAVHPGSRNHVHVECWIDQDHIFDRHGIYPEGGMVVNPLLLFYSAA